MNPEQKTMEHAAAMTAKSRELAPSPEALAKAGCTTPLGNGFNRVIYGSAEEERFRDPTKWVLPPQPEGKNVIAPPWQSHLDTLVAFFAARWPEQVHFRAAWVASPRWSGKAYADYEALEAAMQEEVAKLDPPYQREECLPRVPRLTAQIWIWGMEISEIGLEDYGVGVALWHSVAALALCLHAQKEMEKWTSPWTNSRLYWRRLPKITAEYDGTRGVHHVRLSFRCALEGCEVQGWPDGAVISLI